MNALLIPLHHGQPQAAKRHNAKRTGPEGPVLLHFDSELRYFAVGVALTAAGFAVPLTTFFAVDFSAFFTAFFVAFFSVVLVAEAVLAGLAAGAGVLCAPKETPAIANAMVRLIITEFVLVIFVSVLFVVWR